MNVNFSLIDEANISTLNDLIKSTKFPNKQLPGPVEDYYFNKNYLNKTDNLKNFEQDLLKYEGEKGNIVNPGRFLRNPSPNNPFMNVPITDYDTKQRYQNYNHNNDWSRPTEQTRGVSNEVNNYFNNYLFQDPAGYFFQKENSQRQFYSVPVGSVPSDQTSFANWLYSVPNNCKHGSIWNRYGTKYTDDSLMCNGYNAAEPTNFGHLNQ